MHCLRLNSQPEASCAVRPREPVPEVSTVSEHLLDRRAERIWFGSAAPDDACFEGHISIIEEVVLVRLEGELDVASAPRFERVLSAALEKGASTVMLDLGKLTFLDSTGIHVLVWANRRATDQGSTFVLRSPTRTVLKVLRLTGIDRLMVIESEPSAS
jgi:anti-anti-sigma factor